MILSFIVGIVMDQKTKRILKKTIINLSKLFTFATSFVIYMIACFWISHQTTLLFIT